MVGSVSQIEGGSSKAKKSMTELCLFPTLLRKPEIVIGGKKNLNTVK